MVSIKKGPHDLEAVDAGDGMLHLDCTLSSTQRQSLRQIMKACLRAIDRQSFALAEQFARLGLRELDHIENASGSVVLV